MTGRSRPYGIVLLALLVCLTFLPTCLWGRQKSQGMPPARVSVAKVMRGRVAPQNEFIATIFYQEISDTASEISGLVELGSEILRKRLQATTASFEQSLADLEIAGIDLKRRETLLKKKSISKQSYDENRFQVIGLEKRSSSLKAEVERFEIELEKKIIRAPFDGIVIKRNVDRGEWISEGETVAVIGKDDTIDIVAEIPERFIMIPVQVVGYDGLSAGVESQELAEGMWVVVEGNERLKNGQAAAFQKTED